MPAGEVEQILVCLSGFERSATGERKFKSLADEGAKHQIATFRFDFSGCGISDGTFSTTTLESQGKEFLQAVYEIQTLLGQKPLNVVAHSFGACVLAFQLSTLKYLKNVILIAPALNQKALTRYRFVQRTMRKHSDLAISRENYTQFLDENAFLEDCKQPQRLTKYSVLHAHFYEETQHLDFSSSFLPYQAHTLHLHGTNDTVVPLGSLNIPFIHQVIIKKGDHELEKKPRRAIWIPKVIEFLTIRS